MNIIVLKENKKTCLTVLFCSVCKAYENENEHEEIFHNVVFHRK